MGHNENGAKRKVYNRKNLHKSLEKFLTAERVIHLNVENKKQTYPRVVYSRK